MSLTTVLASLTSASPKSYSLLAELLKALIDANDLTRAQVATTSIDTDVQWLRTTGYANVGDGGGAFYERVGSEPSHAGKVQSADGAWWEMAPEGHVAIAAFGGEVDTATNQLEAIRDAFEVAEEFGVPVLPQNGVYQVTTTGSADQINLKKVPTTLGMISISWDAASGSSNRIFNINGLYGLTSIDSQTGSPTIGQQDRELTVSSGLSLSAGDWVGIRAGADPSDGNQPHWAAVTQVESYSGTTLRLSDGPPVAVNYDAGAAVSTATGVEIYKLAHDPTGGNFDYSVDHTGTTVSPSAACKVQYCRHATISGREIETSYGLTLGDGCEDILVPNYYATHTEAQATAGRIIAQHWGPFSSRNITVQRMHLVSAGAGAPTSGMVHLESASRNIRINELIADITLSADDLTFYICAVQGGSSIVIDDLHLYATHQVRDRSLSNTVGGEEFIIRNLHIHNKGPKFDLRDTLGEIIDYRNGYRFGPLTEWTETLAHTGSGSAETKSLDNVLLAGVAIKSSALTSAGTCRIECTDDNTKLDNLDKTANDAWVRTALSDTAAYWTASGGVAAINRLDLTAKTLRVQSSSAVDFVVKLHGRRVDADQF